MQQQPLLGPIVRHTIHVDQMVIVEIRSMANGFVFVNSGGMEQRVMK